MHALSAANMATTPQASTIPIKALTESAIPLPLLWSLPAADVDEMVGDVVGAPAPGVGGDAAEEEGSVDEEEEDGVDEAEDRWWAVIVITTVADGT